MCPRSDDLPERYRNLLTRYFREQRDKLRYDRGVASRFRGGSDGRGRQDRERQDDGRHE